MVNILDKDIVVEPFYVLSYSTYKFDIFPNVNVFNNPFSPNYDENIDFAVIEFTLSKVETNAKYIDL